MWIPPSDDDVNILSFGLGNVNHIPNEKTISTVKIQSSVQVVLLLVC